MCPFSNVVGLVCVEGSNGKITLEFYQLDSYLNLAQILEHDWRKTDVTIVPAGT